MRWILDASTALAAVLPDEDSTFARAAVAAAICDGLVVPTLWQYEFQNGHATALRRNASIARQRTKPWRPFANSRRTSNRLRGLGRE
jgi:hypothetical protein